MAALTINLTPIGGLGGGRRNIGTQYIGDFFMAFTASDEYVTGGFDLSSGGTPGTDGNGLDAGSMTLLTDQGWIDKIEFVEVTYMRYGEDAAITDPLSCEWIKATQKLKVWMNTLGAGVPADLPNTVLLDSFQLRLRFWSSPHNQ